MTTTSKRKQAPLKDRTPKSTQPANEPVTKRQHRTGTKQEKVLSGGPPRYGRRLQIPPPKIKPGTRLVRA